MGVLLLGNAAYVLAFGDREPQPYDNVNDMNYETPGQADGDGLPFDAADLPQQTENQDRDESKKESVEDVSEKTSDKTQDSDLPSDKNESTGAGDADKGGGTGGDGLGIPKPSPKLESITATWLGSDSVEYGTPLPRAAIHVTAKYDNGDTKMITGWTAGAYDPNRLGPGTLKISYQSKTTSVSYNIVDKEASLSAVWKSGKGSYRYKKDNLQRSDLSVTLTYLSGKTELLPSSGYTVSGFSNAQTGTHSATVIHGDLSTPVSYTVTDYVTGLSASFTYVSVRGDVSWSDIMRGQHIYRVYASGSKEALGSSEYTVSGYSNDSGANGEKLVIRSGSHKLSIGYSVYPAILRVRAIGLDRDILQNRQFIKHMTLSGPGDVSLEDEYVINGETYRFAGFYGDRDCLDSIDIPQTINAEESITYNENSIDVKVERFYYAKYEKVVTPDPPGPVDPQDPQAPVDPQDPADPQDPQDPQNPQDPQDPQDPNGGQDQTAPGGNSGQQDASDPTDQGAGQTPDAPAVPQEPQEPAAPAQQDEPDKPDKPDPPKEDNGGGSGSDSGQQQTEDNNGDASNG